MASALLVTTLLTTGASMYAAKKQEKEQQKISDQQYYQDLRETNEEVRRAKLDNEQQLSRSRALAGASGVRYSGSTKGYIKEMEKTFSVERDWMQKAGQSRASSRYHGATTAAKSQRRSSDVTAAGTGLRSYYSGGGFADKPPPGG